MEAASDIPAKAARHADEPVDGRRGSDVVRTLVLEHGGWEGASKATGASIAELALTAAGIGNAKCDAIRDALPGRVEIPRWRRWARNVRDTIAMALFFPIVLGRASARNRDVPAIAIVQAAPVLVIAGFFVAGVLAKVDLSNVTVGKESFWLFRVGFGTAIAILGLYVAGFASASLPRAGRAARYALIACAVALGYASTIPFGNAVADLATEITETRRAFAENRAEDQEIMAIVKAQPTYNTLPRQRVMQKRLLEATRQSVPGYLESDAAYLDHLRRCFGGAGPKADCAPATERPDAPMDAGALFASLWKRHWPSRS